MRMPFVVSLRWGSQVAAVLFAAVILGASASAQVVSPLFARGYTVVPAPQTVSLGARDFSFGSNWQLKVDKSVAPDDVAIDALRDDLVSRFHIQLGTYTEHYG